MSSIVPPRAMTKIFLSYRRDDSADVAGRIFDHLERRFGRDRLFLDVDSIPYGEDFRRRINEALDDTGLLLAIIGDAWLSAMDDTAPFARRLDDPNDYVGVEISEALKRNITVLPVLVGDARMPRAGELPPHLAELSYRNAAEVRTGRDFPLHVNRLIDAIADVLVLPETAARSLEGGASAARLRLSFAALERDPNHLAGVQLGAFVVERLLAAGGSGMAYLARNPRTGQRVCVKVSLPVLSNMEGIRAAVARGVRGLVALNHPHIVRVHEFDALDLSDARSFYVVMDYVDGELLDTWAGSLTRDSAGGRALLRVASLIARALEAAHACRYVDDAGFETVGVMHGDVKPGNILVRPDGTPALLDFMMVDVQRALDPVARERLASSADDQTAVFGTPGFMAPEQERDGVVTIRTDIYGLGATLRAAAGQLPMPTGFVSLVDRMTGPVTSRPPHMGEVARLLSELAGQEGPQNAEARLEQPEGKRVRPGFFAGLLAMFTKPAALARSTSVVPGTGVSAISRPPELPPIFQLRVVTGPHAGTVCTLTSTRVTVGSATHNDLPLSREPSCSRSHFALNWSSETRTFVVIDFGAPVPLLINGEPLAGSRSLVPGDVLAIGSTELLFERTARGASER